MVDGDIGTDGHVRIALALAGLGVWVGRGVFTG